MTPLYIAITRRKNRKARREALLKNILQSLVGAALLLLGGWGLAYLASSLFTLLRF